MANSLSGDWYFSGTVTPRRFNCPADSITNAAIQASAGVSATKVQQNYSKQLDLTNHATVAAAERRLLHRCRGASGTVVSFGALATVAAVGDSTASVDLLLNGVSILTAAVQLDSGDAAGTLVSGTLSSTALVAGDRLEVNVTVSAGTGTLPKGLCADVLVREDPE